MACTLVLQFPVSSISDFDDLIELERAIERDIGSLGEVEGHDCGSNEGNIFISTSDPERAFKNVKAVLGLSRLETARVAYRLEDSEDYTILWPPELKEFSVK